MPTTPAPRADRWWRKRHHLLALLPFAVCLVVLVLVPTLRMLARAFLEPEPGLGQFAEILGDPLYAQVFWTTLRISFLVTLLSVVLGYPVAHWAAHCRPLTRGIIFAIVLVPFWTSLLVRVYGWTVILQRTGVINQFLRDLGLTSAPLRMMNSEGAVILGMTHYMVPFMVFSIYVALKGIEPNLAAAAMTMGARPFRTFVRITLPLALPGIVAGSTLVFITSIGFYVTAALMGSPRQMMVANLITFQAREALNWPRAAAISTVLIVGVSVFSWLYFQIVDRNRQEAGAP